MKRMTSGSATLLLLLFLSFSFEIEIGRAHDSSPIRQKIGTAQTLAESQIRAESKILFLRLQVTNETVTLVDARAVDGSLKKRRGPLPFLDFQFEVYSSDKKLLYSGQVDNPLVKRYEYEDPDQPGVLRSKTVELDKAILLIRVPYTDNIDHVKFGLRDYQADRSTLKELGSLKIDHASIER